MAESEPALTVAICTRNRRESLLRALASLAHGSRHAGMRWDVLVVDNASQDDTQSAVRALADDFPAPLRVALEPVEGLSYARNCALREARGRAIVFVDDDATCRPGFVAAHMRAFELPGVVATGGRILPVLPADLDLSPSWRAHLANEIGGPTSRYDYGPEPQEIPGPSGLLLPFGANFGVLRALALDLGGFRTDLGYGRRRVPGEETELLRRVARGPGRILYVPGAALDHHVGSERADLAYYLRWNRGYGRSLVRLDPPAGAAQRARRLARELARALVWSLRGRDPRSRRERERALGQALELLRGV